MIKVLILNDVLTKGGKERRIVELLKYCKQHFDVDFEIIFMHDGVDFPDVYDTGYPIHIIKWSNKKARQGFKEILRISRAFQPDIIHSWSSMTDMVGVLLKLYLKKSFVSSMVAVTLPFRSYKDKDYFRSKIAFPFADVITGNTEAGLRSYKAPVAKSVCIYNGFNYDRVSGLGSPELLKEELGLKGKFIVGMVAAFAPRKDYATLITAAKSLLQQYPEKFGFILIGRGPTKKEMMALAGHHVQKEIVFTGLINSVERYINAFDVGVLCSNSSIHGEGISNSIMEYMALAKPVIATEGGGTAEIVLNLQTGFLVPFKNPVVLEEKIVHIMNNPEVANKMGLSGQERIKEHFTIEAMCSSFYDIYKRLAKK